MFVPPHGIAGVAGVRWIQGATNEESLLWFQLHHPISLGPPQPMFLAVPHFFPTFQCCWDSVHRFFPIKINMSYIPKLHTRFWLLVDMFQTISHVFLIFPPKNAKTWAGESSYFQTHPHRLSKTQSSPTSVMEIGELVGKKSETWTTETLGSTTQKRRRKLPFHQVKYGNVLCLLDLW